MRKRFLEAGKIANTHGVDGEVKIQPWADSADFLLKFPALYIDEKPYKLLSGRAHKSMLIARLEGVGDIGAAMALKNRVVFIDRNDAGLEPGVFFIQDIIGASVVDENGAELGTLAEVFESPAANIYVVRGEREILIPAVDEFILNTDAENGKITVRLIEGM
jgi:16S rRNA processing protein RimM